MFDWWRLSRRQLVFWVSLTGQMLAMAGENGELLDPTRPSGPRTGAVVPADAVENPSTPLRLQGTFSMAGQRSAMINGRRVSVGDQVMGAEVLQINKNTVLVRVEGETVELASLVPSVKSPADSQRGER
ncbi:MAG: general secretion pathway protein GspB [Gammaproteobacteria bacterium]|nr:general secretion pathway protein GspB [Gammaproteobacteria bacterium]MCW5585629.1 general secretion pathway protein GspB [Chromatiales bacterium]HPQ24990.1 general secretion pathway protein GspB [Gammaproteobacteria bacterium]